MAEVTELHVNGKRMRVSADPEQWLLDTLRDDLQLTGAKYGCGEGQCGACTVLLDGVPTRSCITPVGSVGGRQVITIEGLERDGKLHPLQEAFIQAGAMQCAYCTSGMIMSGVALLKKNPAPKEEEIVRALDGNVCRCGTYRRILDAVSRAAAMQEARK